MQGPPRNLEVNLAQLCESRGAIRAELKVPPRQQHLHEILAFLVQHPRMHLDPKLGQTGEEDRRVRRAMKSLDSGILLEEADYRRRVHVEVVKRKGDIDIEKVKIWKRKRFEERSYHVPRFGTSERRGRSLSLRKYSPRLSKTQLSSAVPCANIVRAADRSKATEIHRSIEGVQTGEDGDRKMEHVVKMEHLVKMVLLEADAKVDYSVDEFWKNH
ncbi:hypothetical protein C8R44DRAFT_859966 [Mycena epipterygia]|nr:hypothetical protein C8R44DRAFT_859966 [Mycena epipterygia]